MSTATYWPASFVVNSLETFVSRFVSVTFAFATAAPEGSVTVPTIVASCARPCAVKSTRSAASNRTKRRSKRFRDRPILPACVGERGFICQPPELHFFIRGPQMDGPKRPLTFTEIHLTHERCQAQNRYSFVGITIL